VAAVGALIVAAAGFGGVALVFSDRGDDRPAVAADGRIAFAALDEKTWQIFSVETNGTDLVRLTDFAAPSMAYDPAWSPDGWRIAFVMRESDTDRAGMWVMDADGSHAQAVTEHPSASVNPAWSPDGSEIAYAVHGEGGGIYVAPADGGPGRRLTSAGPPTTTRVDTEPEWSPDGGSIAFIRWNMGTQTEPPTYEILEVPATGGDAVVIAHLPAPTRGDADDDGDVRGLSWTPDGSRLAFASGGNIYVINHSGGEPRLLVSCRLLGCNEENVLFTDATTWSPDGQHIAFSVTHTTSERSELYVADANGSIVRQIVGLPESASSPAWQPASRELDVDPVESLQAEVVGTFRVGEDPRSVVYGEGSVWVAVSNNDGTFGGRILRIDPVTNETIAEIPVETIPTWEVGGGAMVVEGDNLWITGGVEAPGGFESPGGGSDAAVTRIDVATNEVADLFALNGTVGADLAFLDGDLWVLLFGDESVDHSMEVVRVDPETGAVLTRISLSSSWAHTLVPADGRLVVYEGGDGAVNVHGHLTSIDPVGGVTTTVDVPSRYFEGGPVLWRGELWFASDRGFSRFDTASNTVTGRGQVLDPSRYAFCCGFVEADDRGIWFLGYDGVQGEGPVRLTLFDPAIDAVTELVTLGDENPVAMAVAPDSVWILNYEGTLTKVDLNQG